MSDSYVIYVIDTETTGLDPTVNDIIELSALRLVRDGDEFKREQKTWYIKPTNVHNISEEALKVNGHKKEDILWETKEGKEKYLELKDVISDFELWVMEDCASVMDRIFAGHNPVFDANFMKSAWSKAGSESTFPFDLTANNRVLDTKQIVIFIDICTGRRRSKYNLSEIVKCFDIKKGKAHRADEDTRMTADFLEKIVKSASSTFTELYKDSYKQS
jgi:DNA polymerase III alpha subunit (gram-positive type)